MSISTKVKSTSSASFQQLILELTAPASESLAALTVLQMRLCVVDVDAKVEGPCVVFTGLISMANCTMQSIMGPYKTLWSVEGAGSYVRKEIGYLLLPTLLAGELCAGTI